ncbi:MAG TPA: quinone-dependent dihydroorotate dehydrogenase [Anaerolineales bacterium]|nr:quinone-dependent dihydroorotate dehydrogenase [Anaerolineales bacterium]
MYRYLRPILFKLPPEAAHTLTLKSIGLVGQIPLIRKTLSKIYTPGASAPVDVFGLRFPNRVGLAAGYDKNGEAIAGLSALGFGHIEIGTVTPLPQPGNPKQRVFRLPEDQAVINRMGFPSRGAKYLLRQVQKSKPAETILGINIGKNKDTPLTEAAQDYITLVQQCAPFADYLAINISSPNTVGLRELQHSQYLHDLLQAISEARSAASQSLGRRVSLVVKLSPDIAISDLDQSLSVILDNQIEGIIATNTTIARPSLASPHAAETGGLSGAPLTDKSTQVIAHIYRQTGGKLPIIGVGGIHSPKDAQKKLDAGASLVQLYTGLVYQGPGLVKQIIEHIS